MKIRIKFKKTGPLKYVGHLDVMRYFQKAIRRAKADIAFSTGFSPHMIMSFAAPLGVGIESEAEYLDIEVNSTKSSKEMISDLNSVMVEGFEILDYRLLPDDSKTAMSVVSCADYSCIRKKGSYTPDLCFLKESVKNFYELPDQILITKETKKGTKEMDLKKLVYSFEVTEGSEGEIRFFLRLSTGSTDNLKPELVLEHFHKFIDIPYERLDYSLQRHEIYSGNNESGFVPLSEMGEYII